MVSLSSVKNYITTDYKKFDTRNVLPKSMEHFAFFDNHKGKAFFSESHEI